MRLSHLGCGWVVQPPCRSRCLNCWARAQTLSCESGHTSSEFAVGAPHAAETVCDAGGLKIAVKRCEPGMGSASILHDEALPHASIECKNSLIRPPVAGTCQKSWQARLLCCIRLPTVLRHQDPVLGSLRPYGDTITFSPPLSSNPPDKLTHHARC